MGAMDLSRLLDGRLKVRHLVLATVIAEQGSLMGAAERLHITQPVVTRGLRELEAVLGVGLFTRGPCGVTPTIYGAVFIEDAQAILAQIRLAGKHVSELQSGTVGRVTVGNHLSGANLLLPRTIARLKRDYPNVTVSVREATPDRLAEGLIIGDVDVVIGRLTPASDDDRIAWRNLYHEPIRIVVRSDHPAATLTDPGLDELMGYPWVLPVPETALHREMELLFSRRGLDVPANRVECTSILTVRTLLAETDPLAVLPVLIVRGDKDLSVLSTDLPGVHSPVGVSVVRGRTMSPAVRIFLDCLSQVGIDIEQSLHGQVSR
ncbi:LysR substrate-binding domain-containing protein [Streptomyces sp. NPDC018964]|uniref:LysR substrate-binding domain-containing protein n=1 Tax=Streptomyces sp. NPDC018964 TaxID=3365058 RepID=UPI00379C0FF4